VRDVTYKNQKVSADRYHLEAVFRTPLFTHPVTFVFLRRRTEWAAVDVRLRGISLIEHYRRKFDGTFFDQGVSGLLALQRYLD